MVGAVIMDGPLIMAARRRPEKADGGLWEFPGGKVEPGETPEDALIREIREELGVEIRVGTFVTRSVRPIEPGTSVANGRLATTLELETYRATLCGRAPVESTDHDELRWMRADELVELDWAGLDLPTVHIVTA